MYATKSLIFFTLLELSGNTTSFPGSLSYPSLSLSLTRLAVTEFVQVVENVESHGI